MTEPEHSGQTIVEYSTASALNEISASIDALAVICKEQHVILEEHVKLLKTLNIHAENIAHGTWEGHR